MNMHWEPQKLAFPKLPKGMEWNLVLATEEAGSILTAQEREEQMVDQTRTIAPRSIAVYEGVMAGKRNRKLLKKDDRTQ